MELYQMLASHETIILHQAYVGETFKCLKCPRKVSRGDFQKKKKKYAFTQQINWEYKFQGEATA